MINFGCNDDGSNSIREGDFGSCADDNFFSNVEEEKQSNASRSSKGSHMHV